MAQWEPVGIEGALELLSPIFYDDRVRRYAVARLGAFSTEVAFLSRTRCNHLCLSLDDEGIRLVLKAVGAYDQTGKNV